MRIQRTVEFNRWFKTLRLKEQAQIDSRLYRIECYEHFGDAKDLGKGLAELRWPNGRRVYFIRVIDEKGNLVLLVLGGLNNAQKKNIRQARLLIQKYTSK